MKFNEYTTLDGRVVIIPDKITVRKQTTVLNAENTVKYSHLLYKDRDHAVQAALNDFKALIRKHKFFIKKKSGKDVELPCGRFITRIYYGRSVSRDGKYRHIVKASFPVTGKASTDFKLFYVPCSTEDLNMKEYRKTLKIARNYQRERSKEYVSEVLTLLKNVISGKPELKLTLSEVSDKRIYHSENGEIILPRTFNVSKTRVRFDVNKVYYYYKYSDYINSDHAVQAALNDFRGLIEQGVHLIPKTSPVPSKLPCGRSIGRIEYKEDISRYGEERRYFKVTYWCINSNLNNLLTNKYFLQKGDFSEREYNSQLDNAINHLRTTNKLYTRQILNQIPPRIVDKVIAKEIK